MGAWTASGGAPHPPPMAGVDARDGRDLLPGQVLERPAQSLLVAFDGEHVVAALIADPLGGVHLCVHGVGGDHYPVEVEPELHRLGWFVFQSGVFRWDSGGGVVVSGH